jgi:hypothetical protein
VDTEKVELQQRIITFITRANWFYLALTSTFGLLFTPADIAKGIIAGGLIVTVSFHWLYRSLSKSLTPPHLSRHNVVMAKYLIRFFSIMVLIFILIRWQWVNPLGLIVGLSVVVASIMTATFLEIKRLFCKEAV